MPSFQNSELLPKREIFQNEVATALKSADECPKPEGKHVEHDPGVISGRGHRSCSKLLILRSARVLTKDSQRLSQEK
jgi:hypothetical protein